MQSRLTLAAAFVSLIATVPIPARADGELSVRTIEHGTWPASVAALQSDLRAEGRSVRVFVRDETGRAIRCGGYGLLLDPVSAAAFVIGTCDPGTGATTVTLAHRGALFTHDAAVPQPLAAGLSVAQIRTVASSGRAASTGGSESECSIAVRPFLNDLEQGTRIYLYGARFMLRPLAGGVVAEPTADGWVLRGGIRAATSFQYEVVDMARNEVVLRERTALSCATENVNALEPIVIGAAPRERSFDDASSACTSPFPLPTNTAVNGSTRGGACGPLFVVDLRESSNLILMLSSDFGGSVNVYARPPETTRRTVASSVYGGGPDQRMRWDLPAGRYYIELVDADIHVHPGRFTLGVDLQPGFASVFGLR